MKSASIFLALAALLSAACLTPLRADAGEQRRTKGDYIFAVSQKYFDQCTAMQKANNFSDLTGMFDGGACGLTKENQIVEVVEMGKDGTARVVPKGSMSGPVLLSVDALK